MVIRTAHDGAVWHAPIGDRFFGIETRLVAPPARHLLGAPTYVEDGRTVLLDGGCLVAGCCGVMARVSVGVRTVQWTDFFTRGLPEVPTDASFEFDRQEYEAALASVEAVEIEPLPADDV